MAISNQDLARLGDAYGVRFREQLQLESASELERRWAEADAARRRAEELEAAALDKHQQRQAASQRAQAANTDADEAASARAGTTRRFGRACRSRALRHPLTKRTGETQASR